MRRRPTAADRAARKLRCLLALVVVVGITSACGLGRLGSEGGSPPLALELHVQNSSDTEYFYLIRGFADDQQQDVFTNYALFAVPPGEDYRIGAGPDRDDDQAARCFVDEQYWVVRSLSSEPYWKPENRPPRDPTDLELIEHLGPESCFDSSEITVEVGGS